MIRTAFVFLLALGLVPVAMADMPTLMVSIENGEELGVLRISSSILWNMEETGSGQIETSLGDQVFINGEEGYEVTRDFILGVETVTLTLLFPPRETGRMLNETTRAELWLYLGGRTVFHSENFGQVSQEFTAIPESGVKFRPMTVTILNDLDAPRMRVSGVYGSPSYMEGVDAVTGLTLEFEVDESVDDDLMNELVARTGCMSNMSIQGLFTGYSKNQVKIWNQK